MNYNQESNNLNSQGNNRIPNNHISNNTSNTSFCIKCGNKLNPGAEFCTSCGNKIVHYDNIRENRTDTFGNISLVLGIISLVLTFIISIFVLPVAITGLVLGIAYKLKGGKKIAGIILNTLSIFIIISMIVVGIGSFLNTFSSNTREANSFKKIATEETIKYIKNKYNLDIKNDNITDVYLKKASQYDALVQIDPYYTGIAEQTVVYNNKTFKVLVNYFDKNMDEYYDSYEQDIIIDGLKNHYCEKLGISKENTQIYVPDYFVYYKHTHNRYQDVVSFINSVEKETYNNIYIVTKDVIDNGKITKVEKEFNNIDLKIYKLHDEANLNDYSDILFKVEQDTDYGKKIFNDKQSAFLEEEYNCSSYSKCYYVKYIINNLGNNIYIRNRSDYNITVQKITDFNQISIYQNKIKNSGYNDLKILDLYKLNTSFDNYEISFKSIDIYNFNDKVEGNHIDYYKTYPLIIENDLISSISANNILMSKEEIFVALVNK